MTDAETVTVTGILKIEIPDPAISLFLIFEPSDDGDHWTPGKIAASLRERGITAGYSQEKLAAFLKKARHAPGKPFRHELIKGTAPEDPQPDTVHWKPLPEGQEHGDVKESVLAQAGAPELYREVREKVEKKKTVEKKGNAPFGQARTETITVTETVTRKEPADVDPRVLRSEYVRAGSVLGTVTSRLVGLPGTDIYGNTIPIGEAGDLNFYHGDHIVRQGNTLTAERSGFLRVGANWADVVPFEPHQWSISISRDKATCFLDFTPGHSATPLPDVTEVLHAAKDHSYPEEHLLSPEDVTVLMERQVRTGEPAQIPLSKPRDAAIEIVVAEDSLSAHLSIRKGTGAGKALKLKEIGTAIKESGLAGLNLPKIKEDITTFFEGPDFELTGYLLCEGVAPVPGEARNAEFAPTYHEARKTEEIKKELAHTVAEGADNLEEYPSLSDFPPDSITKTADVVEEQLICSFDPPTPGQPGRDVYGKTIQAEAGRTPDIVLHENLIQKNNVIVGTVPGVLDYGEIDETIHLRVRAHVDATIAVSVSSDRMEGLLSLTEGIGTGSRLSMEEIRTALEENGVVHGVDDERILKALDTARTGVAVKEFVVAEGTPAIDQSENRIEFIVDISSDPGVRIRKDGSADFRNRNTITTVEKGEPICRILPSQQEPVDGMDVTGKAIPAQNISGLQLELGENVLKEEQDDGEIIIVATTDGELLYDSNRLAVETVHTIKGDVNMKVGNVKFPGTVLIDGTVRTGFYVISGGDIKISGGVEGALLSSDGDILIKQGVKGAGKAVLRSKKGIMSPFVELATLLSVGNVTLKSSVVRSRIKCNGRISFQGDNGRIVGGQIRARNGVEAGSIGTPRGIKTELSFGQDYLIADLIEKEEEEIEKVKKRITQVDHAMQKSEKGLNGDSQLQTLRKEKVNLLKLMEKRGLRLFTLRERYEQHFPSKVVIKGDVYAGTVFESHGRVYEITSPRKGISVEFNPQTGNIEISELKNGSEE